MPHAALTPAAPADQTALALPPPTATRRRSAPWRAAVAVARAAHRAARIAARSTQRAARTPAAEGQTRAATGDSPLELKLAARIAGLRAPAIPLSQDTPTPGPTAPSKPFRTDP
jgi:hypothetical protein